ncbi:hypothetical protein HDK90DRAFT_466518 [Phyllosticta capitalensis]|uniref:Uncharacterized protein n=1 Tax=Phyllosticta capitalensis TaxID=121624 RepID=A0ABR1YMF9_9PEZI
MAACVGSAVCWLTCAWSVSTGSPRTTSASSLHTCNLLHSSVMLPLHPRKLGARKSRSQIFRPLSPVLDAVSRLLRPSSAQSQLSSTAPTASTNGRINNQMDRDIVPVPTAPLPPETPYDHVVPSSPAPSTCGSSTSSGSILNFTPDLAASKRRRLQRLRNFEDGHVPPPAPFAPEPRTVLEKIVLQLFDEQRMDWMMIAEPLQRVYGLEVTSAGVLFILQQHGRVQRTMWWD